MAKPLLERLGVVDHAHEKIIFLIRHHLEMARIWQRFDLDDPATAQNFSTFIGDRELLRYLYVLTFCDARGTTPELWNDFKDVLHRQLFTTTLQCLNNPDATPLIPANMISKERILSQLSGFSEDEIEAHFSLLPDRYFHYSNEEEILLHLRMIHQLLHTISTADSIGSLVPVVEWQDDPNLGLTVVHVVTWDRAGLFYRLAGAFALAGLSIVSSKALSRADHITIDTFYVTDASGGMVRKERALRAFKDHLGDILLNNLDIAAEIEAFAESKRQPSYLQTTTTLPAAIPPKVEIYHELSLKRTIIEIEANDEIGLLYRLAHAIFKHGFDITFARISTEKDVAVDAFYIEPVQSGVDTSQQLVELRATLTRIVEATAAGVETPLN
jgi:[protein-PII] uridylyltransferase